MSTEPNNLDDFMDDIVSRNPGEEEFHQAVREVAEKVIPFVKEHPKYDEARILDPDDRAGPDPRLPGLLGGRRRARCGSTGATGCSSATPSGRTRAGCVSIRR